MKIREVNENMKCEIERMEINYTFYFFSLLKSD